MRAICSCSKKVAIELCDNPEISFLAHFYSGTAEKIIGNGVSYEPLNCDETPTYFYNATTYRTPIDRDMIEKMQSYETIAYDLIFRWRSSLETGSNYNKIRILYYQLMQYWLDYIIEKEIDCFLCTDTPHNIHIFLVYAICQIKGIPVVIGQSLPPRKGVCPQMFFITKIGELYPGFQEYYEKLCNLYKNCNADDIDIKPEIKSYACSYEGLQSTNHINSVVAVKDLEPLWITCINRSKIYIAKGRLTTLLIKIWNFMWVKTKNKRALHNEEMLEEKPNMENKYLYFPLHFQPEASSCPTSGVYRYLDLIIQIVSRSLPRDFFLYVKEHPAYWINNIRRMAISDARPSRYYDFIFKTNNIKLVLHDYDSIELMKNSEGVITANGTIGWEAICSQKPLIVFGNSFYTYLTGVLKVRNLKDCKDAIEKVVNGTAHVPTRKDILVFLKALEPNMIEACEAYEYCFQYNANFIEENVNTKRIANGMIKFLKATKFQACKMEMKNETQH